MDAAAWKVLVLPALERPHPWFATDPERAAEIAGDLRLLPQKRNSADVLRVCQDHALKQFPQRRASGGGMSTRLSPLPFPSLLGAIEQTEADLGIAMCAEVEQ